MELRREHAKYSRRIFFILFKLIAICSNKLCIMFNQVSCRKTYLLVLSLTCSADTKENLQSCYSACNPKINIVNIPGNVFGASREMKGKHDQWRRLHGSRGTCLPHFYKWLGTGGTVIRRTANKKLAKLYWPSRKRSPTRLFVLLEPKVERHDKFFPGTSRPIGAHPHFRTGPIPPLSNTFRFHWVWLRI